MPEPEDNAVDDDESLTRFVYNADEVNRAGRVKPGAFLPTLETHSGRWETSVCRMNGCTEERVWDLARTQRPDRTVKARADHSVQSAVAVGLVCVAAPVHGFPEHAVLLGWPGDKPAQKDIAIGLAKASKAVFPPTV